MHNVDFKSDLWTLYYIWNLQCEENGFHIDTIFMHNVDFESDQ